MAFNSEKLKGLSSFARYLKWTLITLSAAICGLLLAGLLWLYLNPISKFDERIKKHLTDITQAEKVSWKILRWGFQPSKFNLGVRGESVVFENGLGFKKIIIPEIDISVSFWKLILLKFPLLLEIKKPYLELRQETVPQRVGSKPIEIPAILSHLRLNTQIHDGRIIWHSLQDDEIYDLRHFNLLGVIAGIPGSFSFKVDFDPALNIPSISLLSSKKMNFDIEGTSTDYSGKLIRIEVEKFLLNLDNSLLLVGSLLEKIPEVPLRLEGDSTFIINKDGSLDSFLLKSGKFQLSKLFSKLHLEYSKDQGSSLDFSLSREHYKDLKLPFKYLRNLPMDGVLEWGFVYQNFKGKDPYLKWKIALNNLNSDLKHRNPVADSFSEGPFILSVLSEGLYQNNQLSSPRTEIQIKATDAKISLNNGQIEKQKGERFDLELKARVEDNALLLDRLIGKLHTLELQSSGKIENVSEWLRGGEAPAKFAFLTNKVNLRDWANVFKFINQTPPLEGLFEVAGEIDSKLSRLPGHKSSLGWKIDKAYLQGLRGMLDPAEMFRAGYLDKDSSLDGSFSADLILSARGKDSLLEKASARATVNLSDLSFVWKKKFQKSSGIPLKLSAAIEATQNEIQIQQASFQFHTLLMKLSGKLRQGSGRSSVMLNMIKPVELSDWKPFFPKTTVPLAGQISWNGWLGFAASDKNFANNVDLNKVTLKGALNFSNIRGKIPDSTLLIREANARIAIGDGGLTVQKALMRWDDNKVNFQGNSFPLKAQNNGLTISDILSNKSWEHKYNIKLHHFVPSETSENKSKNDKPIDLIELLRNPQIKNSQYDLNMTVDEGRVGGIAFKALKARTIWKDSQLVLNPFEISALQGQLSGSAGINAQEFYLRNQDPTFSSTFRVSNLNIGELILSVKPEMKDLFGGYLDGGLVLSGQGILFDDLIKKARGRIQGKLRNGHFETFKVLKGQIDQKIQQSDLNKWLAGEVKGESCLQRTFVADFDAEIKDGTVDISQSKINFTTTQSRIQMTGQIDPQLNINVKGNFYAGDACISGDIRNCLSKNKEGAAIPFFIQGPASQAQAKVDYAGLTRQIALCIKENAQQKVTETIQNEIKNNAEIKKIKDQTAEKLKNLFKGR